MGKYLSIIIGALVVVLGVVLLYFWWYDFLIIIKGTFPGLLIFGGVIAIFAGFGEIKDTKKLVK